jgi:predicted metal-dependent hydrolase
MKLIVRRTSNHTNATNTSNSSRTASRQAPITIQPDTAQDREQLEQCEDVSYRIRRFRQAKRMSLKVTHDGRVWVSLPQRGSARDAREFVRQNIDHIRTTLARLSKRNAERQNARQHAPLRLPMDGVWHTVEIVVEKQYHLHTDATTATLRITIPRLNWSLILNWSREQASQSNR